MNYGRPQSLPRPPRNNDKVIEVHFLRRILVFLDKKSWGGGAFLVNKHENDKIKNLIEASLGGLSK